MSDRDFDAQRSFKVKCWNTMYYPFSFYDIRLQLDVILHLSFSLMMDIWHYWPKFRTSHPLPMDDVSQNRLILPWDQRKHRKGSHQNEWVSELVYLTSLLNSQGLMSDGPGAGQWDEGWKCSRLEYTGFRIPDPVAWSRVFYRSTKRSRQNEVDW